MGPSSFAPLLTLSATAMRSPASVCFPCRIALNGFRETAKTPLQLAFGQVRHASHGKSTVANGPKRRPGRRLGLKRAEGEYVTPNTIIFRQRGTQWHPGENCHRGRDHTINASEPGYIRYYRDPQRHPDRKFIGIVFNADDRLPYPINTPRRRRLGLVAVPITDEVPDRLAPAPVTLVPVGKIHAKVEGGAQGGLALGKGVTKGRQWPWEAYTNSIPLPTGNDGSYRISNFEIGRAAERAGVKPRPYKKKDRLARFIEARRAQRKTSAKRGPSKKSLKKAAKAAAKP